MNVRNEEGIEKHSLSNEQFSRARLMLASASTTKRPRQNTENSNGRSRSLRGLNGGGRARHPSWMLILFANFLRPNLASINPSRCALVSRYRAGHSENHN